MAMRELLRAVRALPLRYSTRWAAIELAFRARGNGEVEISYYTLAQRLHVCLRTAFRVIENLLQDCTIARTRTRLGPHEFARNRYRFLIPWRTSAHPFSSDKSSKSSSFLDKMSCTLPRSSREKGEKMVAQGESEERGKTLSIREEIRHQKKTQQNLTPGSGLWQICQDEIQRLEALLAAAPPDAAPGA